MNFKTQRDSMVQQLNQEEQERLSGRPRAPRRRRIRIRTLILILLSAALVTVAFAGWRDLYSHWLEKNAPIIMVEDLPRGIGLTPISIRFTVRDDDAGLDEIIVRAHQRGQAKELLRKGYDRDRNATIVLDFAGDKSILDEGTADIEIRVFDRSIWSNRAEKTIPLRIDYRRPRVEIVSTQHNAREGGAQLLFYRAFDEDLAISGVKVANRTYIGFPASRIDKAIDEPGLHVALYAIEMEKNITPDDIRIFAEDQVGNAVSSAFYNKVAPRSSRKVTVTLGDDYLRQEIAPLAELHYARLLPLIRAEGNGFEFRAPKGSLEQLRERFEFVNAYLRTADESEISSLLKGSRFERYWEGPFLRPFGSIRFTFGDELQFLFDKQSAGALLHRGYDIDVPRDNRTVAAVNEGIVAFSENIGSYGRMIAIDHGLGLVSLYANLESVSVDRGEKVTQGQPIGTAGRGGVAGTSHLYFEMRIHGIPVDPGEWMDRGWYEAHILGKINQIKTSLGIPVYRPL